LTILLDRFPSAKSIAQKKEDKTAIQPGKILNMNAPIGTAAFVLLQIEENTATVRRYILNPHLASAVGIDV